MMHAMPSTPNTGSATKNMPIRKSLTVAIEKSVAIGTSQGQGTGKARLVVFTSNRKRTLSQNAVAKPGTNTIIPSIGR